jgi:hypothetical protein
MAGSWPTWSRTVDGSPPTPEVGPEQLQGRPLQVTAVHKTAARTTQALEEVGGEADAGRLQVPTTRTYRLHEVA